MLHLKLPHDPQSTGILHSQIVAALTFLMLTRVIGKAVQLLSDERVPEDGSPPKTEPLPLPGQSGFLDLLRAVIAMRPNNPKDNFQVLNLEIRAPKQPDAANR